MDVGTVGKGKETQVQHGLPTPGNSLEPDTAAIDADKARQAAEAQALQSDALEGGGDNDEDDSGEYELGDGSEDENKEIERILDRKTDRGVLGIKKRNYETPGKRKTEVLKAFRKLGILIHPDYTDNPRAEEAFRKLQSAAANLGIGWQYTEEIENWNGESEFLEIEFTEDSSAIPPPNDFVLGIYKKATKHIKNLFGNTSTGLAMARLNEFNKQIEQKNQETGIVPDQWTIAFPTLAANYDQARPYYQRLLNTPPGQPDDDEAKTKLEEINSGIIKFNDEHHYRREWAISPPTVGEKFVAQEQAKKAKEKAAQVNPPPAQVNPPPAQVNPPPAQKTIPPNTVAPGFGKIQFPWVTYLIPTGERIIAGRQRAKDDVAGSLCCVELPSTNPDKPNFRFRDDIDIISLQEYFATSGIKLMGETDDEGRPVKVWRRKDRKDFKKFLFCVVWKGGRSDLTRKTKPNCPETLCCFVTAKGVELATRSGFKNLVGAKSGDGYIRTYCQDMSITAPWDVAPTSYIIAPEQKTILDKVQASMTANLEAGHSASGWKTVNSPPGNSDITAILLRIERNISSLQQKVATSDKELAEMGIGFEYIAQAVSRIVNEEQIDVSDIPEPKLP